MFNLIAANINQKISDGENKLLTYVKSLQNKYYLLYLEQIRFPAKNWLQRTFAAKPIRGKIGDLCGDAKKAPIG
ncbi:MAG: hypothetical protein LBO71_04795 [Prevotellaceae bacterium]|nr:hypothetical protein [Prevotellaceae bacterium]